MFKKLSFRATSLIVALVLALGSAVTAFAITIVVDGNQDAVWTTGSGGQTPGSGMDPDESSITNNVDISVVRWTNDSTNMYFEIETYANPPRLGLAPFLTQLYICIDSDNNLSTGSAYSNCNGSGFDRYIYVLGNIQVQVQDQTFTQIGTGTLGYNASAATPVIEISVALSDLGFGPGNCPATIPVAVYYDNGSSDPDDHTPDVGTMNIGCGSPTAITLSTLSAASGTPYLPLALAGAAFVLVAGAGLALRKRYMA
ncbi:MAG: hypothetical protein Fur0018_21690 [Anaerolineales bacterium]